MRYKHTKHKWGSVLPSWRHEQQPPWSPHQQGPQRYPIHLGNISQGGPECLQITGPGINGLGGGDNTPVSMRRASRPRRKLLSPLARRPGRDPDHGARGYLLAHTFGPSSVLRSRNTYASTNLDFLPRRRRPIKGVHIYKDIKKW